MKIRCYDPRDLSQHPDDEDTWKETCNPALVAAHFQSGRWGRLNWAQVADTADYCDEYVALESSPKPKL